MPTVPTGMDIGTGGVAVCVDAVVSPVTLVVTGAALAPSDEDGATRASVACTPACSAGVVEERVSGGVVIVP